MLKLPIEIEKFLLKMRRRQCRPQYYYDIARLLRNLPTILSLAGCSAQSLAELSPVSFKLLVSYWCDRGITLVSVHRYLTIIRKMLKKKGLAYKMPSNHMLLPMPRLPRRLFVNHSISAKNILPHDIRWVCLLQQHFGIKKGEAMLLRSYMLTAQYLQLPRSIAYNSKAQADTSKSTLPYISKKWRSIYPCLRQR